jgi:glycerol kinase
MGPIEVMQGMSRSFEFQINRDGNIVDTDGFAVEVIVVDHDGTELYRVVCPIKGNDTKTRIVTIEGAATAIATTREACIHWTDTAGKPDAEPFLIQVKRHP